MSLEADGRSGGASLAGIAAEVAVQVQRAASTDLRLINTRLRAVGLSEYSPFMSCRSHVAARTVRSDDFWQSEPRKRARGCIVGIALVRLLGQRRNGSLSLHSQERRMFDRLVLPKAKRFLVFSS